MTLCLYITHLSQTLSYVTIRNYVSSVWVLHDFEGVDQGHRFAIHDDAVYSRLLCIRFAVACGLVLDSIPSVRHGSHTTPRLFFDQLCLRTVARTVYG